MKSKYENNRWMLPVAFLLALATICSVLLFPESNHEKKAESHRFHKQPSLSPQPFNGSKPTREEGFQKLPAIIEDPYNCGLTQKEWSTLEFARKVQKELAKDEQAGLGMLIEEDLDQFELWILRDTLFLHYHRNSSFSSKAAR